MSKTHFFKRHNGDYAWNYYKLSDEDRTPHYKMIGFLTDTPCIHFMELDLSLLSHKTQYDALWEVCAEIGAAEYETAWRRVMAGSFDLYLNGQRVSDEG